MNNSDTGAQSVDFLTRLKPAERKIWIEYMNNGFVKIDAFATTNKSAIKGIAAGKNKNDYKVTCTRIFKRIMSVMTQEELLNQFGLGKERVMTELDSRLKANTDKYYQDIFVKTLEDNTTRMKATELLSRIHGMDKQVIVDDSKSKVEIYIPDNKRDTDTPEVITMPANVSDEMVKMIEHSNPGVKVILEDVDDE